MTTIDSQALAIQFSDARSHNGWTSDPVTDAQLEAAYDIAKWGPTSMNTQPQRIVFLRTDEAKQRIRPALAPGNVDKSMTAPVLAIFAYDTAFYTKLTVTFPHKPDADKMFIGNEGLIQGTAFRNATLQAAYFMIALRSVGLDVGPMSGFNPAKVDEEFFSGTTWKSNFLCGIGHGDTSKLFGRLPRLPFADATTLL